MSHINQNSLFLVLEFGPVNVLINFKHKNFSFVPLKTQKKSSASLKSLKNWPAAEKSNKILQHNLLQHPLQHHQKFTTPPLQRP